MRKPRTTNAEEEGLLARIESLSTEEVQGREMPAGELAQALYVLAERIAETVALRLAEDLLSLPTGSESTEKKRG